MGLGIGLAFRAPVQAAALFHFTPATHDISLLTNLSAPATRAFAALYAPSFSPRLLSPSPFPSDMASVSASFTGLCCPMARTATLTNQATGKVSAVKLLSFGVSMGSFPSLRSSRLRIFCAAKPETVDKVCEIVRKQLALPPETTLSGESAFSALGADSLDTVEIVMGLEEEFGITVEEDGSQNITTVQEAADLIEALVQKKAGAA